MKITKEFTDDHQVRITTEFEADLYESYKHRAARNLTKKNKISGFRPGKAPYSMVVTQFGEETIAQEAIDLILDQEYPKVVDAAEIKPSGPGSLEQITSDEPLTCIFLVPLEPEVKLGKYKELRKTYSPEDLDEKKVDNYIYQLRRNSATIVPSTESAEEGNLVFLSLTAIDNNTADEETTKIVDNQPQQVIIPTKEEEKETEWPFKGFTRKLIGKNSGDHVEISHKFSKDHSNEQFQGKSMKFSVNLQEVKKLELPELDAEFLATLGEYENADQLREDISKRMREDLINTYNDHYFLELLDEMRSSAKIKYPPQVLDNEIEKVIERVEADLRRQSLDFETYLKVRKQSKEEFIENEARPAAIHRLERSLVMDAFAEDEGIKLDEDKMNESIRAVINEISYEGNLSELQKKMGNESFSNAVTMEAANRTLNLQIHEKLKEIATGEAKTSKSKKSSPKTTKTEKPEAFIAEVEEIADPKSSNVEKSLDTEKETGSEE